MSDEVLNAKAILKEIVEAHEDWTPEQIKAELYRRLIMSSPAFIDDSHGELFRGGR